jgi:hypothetical protein
VREDGAVVVVIDAVVEGVVGRDDGVGNHNRGAVGWGRGAVELGPARGACQEGS